MKLGEIVVHIGNYNFTKVHQNQMKNKKVLLMARFSVQNFSVSRIVKIVHSAAGTRNYVVVILVLFFRIRLYCSRHIFLGENSSFNLKFRYVFTIFNVTF